MEGSWPAGRTEEEINALFHCACTMAGIMEIETEGEEMAHGPGTLPPQITLDILISDDRPWAEVQAMVPRTQSRGPGSRATPRVPASLPMDQVSHSRNRARFHFCPIWTQWAEPEKHRWYIQGEADSSGGEREVGRAGARAQAQAPDRSRSQLHPAWLGELRQIT